MKRTMARVMNADDPRLADFRMLWRAGRSRQEMANLLGVNPTTITAWAKILRIKLPTQAQAMKARWADPDFRQWRMGARG